MKKKQVLNRILRELESVQSTLDKLAVEASDKIKRELTDIITEQSIYIQRTKEYVDISKTSKDACESLTLKYDQRFSEQLKSIEQLLNTARNEYNDGFSVKYRELLEEAAHQAESLHKANLETVDTLHKNILEKQAAFHEQMNVMVDRQLTEFLAKQNVLIQNFGQQVDGFQRLLNSQKGELDQTNSSLKELETKALSAFAGYSQMLIKQDGEITLLKERDSQLTSLTDRFEKVLEGLQSTSLIGSKFKGL